MCLDQVLGDILDTSSLEGIYKVYRPVINIIDTLSSRRLYNVFRPGINNIIGSLSSGR